MGNIVNDQHNVILMSNGRYRCDDCGDIGSGYWAVSHQFPPRGEWSNTYRGGGSGDLSPDPSSDNLRTSIVNAMRANGYGADDDERIKCAEMLIRVLGWQREEAIFAELPDYDKYTVHVNVKAHRYVTDWEADPADELTAITEELGLYD